MKFNQDHYSTGIGQFRPQKPSRVESVTIRSASLQIERKTYLVQLQENPRGRLLRITEECKGHRNAIVIPATGLEEFHRVLSAIAECSGSGEAPQPGPVHGADR